MVLSPEVLPATKESQSSAAQSGWRGLSLCIALTIMVVGSAYPFFFTLPGAPADKPVHHGYVMVLLWAMCAGLVHGVGFVPRWAPWRWLFSGWACLFALGLAAFLRTQAWMIA
ncbi:hypothetical protein Cenrod_0320 [Candidatus Symbiobacter mobilis CR]|uniref:Cyd operon protein YbgE n=1 Tax=Candidatus Symbiobacter mobilis CR TaxID=946483 RepID=U5N8E8_9BURK|nr:hypothetical protein Cenrod_0320 [Candidatus Symbiobacter mobilis CR]